MTGIHNDSAFTVVGKIIGGLIVGIILFYLQRFYKKIDAEKSRAIEREFSNKEVDASKIQDFNRAAAKLKTALAEAENWLQFTFPKGSYIKVAGKLKEFDPIHPKALMEFRAHIPENRQAEFDRACQKYYYPDPDSEEKRPFFQYALAHISENTTSKFRLEILK